MGSLEIVVANAGIVSTGPLEEVSDQVWQQLLDTNLTGVFHTLRAAIPVMRRQRFGRIVVTSSVTSLTARSRQLLFTRLARDGPVQPAGCYVRRVRQPARCARSVGKRIPPV
jgi:NAD(P)-dependent dehydrogenase (short-subunit alcohol dehydrogenase family)